MKQKTSPEPWRFTPELGIIMDEDGIGIAQVWNKHEVDFPNALGNGYALAAVPALIAACQELVDWNSNGCPMVIDWRPHTEAVKMAAEALALARPEWEEATFRKPIDTIWLYGINTDVFGVKKTPYDFKGDYAFTTNSEGGPMVHVHMSEIGEYCPFAEVGGVWRDADEARWFVQSIEIDVKLDPVWVLKCVRPVLPGVVNDG